MDDAENRARLQEQSDMGNALDLFGMGDLDAAELLGHGPAKSVTLSAKAPEKKAAKSAATGMPALAEPKTKKEYKEYGEAVGRELARFAGKAHFNAMMQGLLQASTASATVSVVKPIQASLNGIIQEKTKAEKGVSGGGGKKKKKYASVNVGRGGYGKTGGGAYDQYDEFADFM